MTRKTILITGASRGIGRAAALLAGRRGWSVGVTYVRDEESAQRTVREIQRSGGRAVATSSSGGLPRERRYSCLHSGRQK